MARKKINDGLTNNQRAYQKNKEVIKARNAAYRLKYPERVRASRQREGQRYRERYRLSARKFHTNHPTYSRFLKLKQRYGITAKTWHDMFEAQEGRCLICKTHEDETSRKRLFVDHNHTTGKVRALLCDPCNRMLADAKESSTLLRIAAEYLEEH